jgi:hypothetical protein
MVSLPGHHLNNNGSNAPQIMENIEGTAHYGVMIRTTDGGVTAFKALRPPLAGASAPTIAAFHAARDIGADIEVTMDLSLLPGNPLWLPICTWNYPITPGGPGMDDHFSVAIGVDYLNRVWVSGNARENYVDEAHSGSLHWTRYDPGLNTGNFDDPTSWTTPAYPDVFLNCGQNKGHTYHQYVRLSNGTLILFISQMDEGGLSRGRDFLAFYLNSTTSGTWQPLIDHPLASGVDMRSDGLTSAKTPAAGGHFAQVSGGPSRAVVDTPTFWAGPPNRVYISNVFVQKISPTVDRLHVAGVWRVSDADSSSSMQPWYVYCDNPVGNANGWKTVTGASQPMPIAWTEALDNRHSTVTIIGPGTIIPNFGKSLTIDEYGHPHFIMQNGTYGNPPWKADTTIPLYAESVYINSLGNSGSVMHVWWDGTLWQKRGVPVYARGFSSTPNIIYAGGQGLMVAPADQINPTKLYILTNWGEDGFGPLSLQRGRIVSGGEINFDPVSATKGELAIMVPDVNIPRVYWFGLADNAIARPEFHNTDPGP